MDDELDLDIETEDLQECYGSLFYNFGKGSMTLKHSIYK